MYTRKIPFDIDCGVKITMELIGGKWKSCLLLELAAGDKRPSELHRLFPDASPRVINHQLKEMEFYGLIRKNVRQVMPPHTEYAITERGRSLLPLIHEIEAWGDQFRPTMRQLLGL